MCIQWSEHRFIWNPEISLEKQEVLKQLKQKSMEPYVLFYYWIISSLNNTWSENSSKYEYWSKNFILPNAPQS